MSNAPPFAPGKPGFTSFKCREPILYPHRWQRDALVQATLEPTVAAMSAPSSEQSSLPPPIEFAYACRIAGTEFLVVVADREILGPILPSYHPTVLRITRRSLLAEPLASTAKSIWAHKRFMADPADRMRVTEAVTDLPQGKAVQSIFPLLRSEFLDPIRQLFSMLANGYLVADLNSGLTPSTRLRLGPAAIGDEPTRPRDRLLRPLVTTGSAQTDPLAADMHHQS